MSTAVAKPVMRGLLKANIKRNIVGMIVSSIAGAALFHFGYAAPKKQAYADFYKTYDAEARLKIMNDAGLMQSCPK